MVLLFSLVSMTIFSFFSFDLMIFALVGVMFLTFLNLEGVCYSFLVSLNCFSVGMVLLSFLLGIFMLYSSTSLLKESFFWSEFCFCVSSIILVLFFCFSVTNFFLFYVMFEFSVIPTFFLIMGWGYSVERFQAAMYMYMYTLVASVPFFLFLLSLFLMGCSFFFDFIYFYIFIPSVSSFWWLFSSLIFMIKFPIYYFHIWLPKAHVEAPVAGSMILAAVLLKLGGFGFFKLMYFTFFTFGEWFPMLFSISMLGSFFISVVCLRQSDIKSLVAYSSVSHMGPTFCSILTASYIGWASSFFIMISHGICSSGLFYIIGLLYDRWSSRSILVLKGLVMMSPVMSFWWLSLCASNMAFPPSLNFFSELMMFFSVVSWESSSLFFVCLVLFFSGVYSIYLFTSIFHAFSNVNLILNKPCLQENFLIFLHCFPIYFMLFFISFLF